MIGLHVFNMIKIDQHHNATIIFLDRPAKRNAMTPEMLGELASTLEAIAAGSPPHNAVKAVVLAGSGECFCAGFDLKMCLQTPGTTATLLRELSRCITAMVRIERPVVIAATSVAVAGACALFGGADAVIGNVDGKYGYPVLKLGLSPAVSAPFMVPQLAYSAHGVARSRLLDTGLIDGREARRIGLLTDLVDWPEDCIRKSLSVASMLAAKPVLAFASTKRLLAELCDTHALAERALAASLTTADTADMHTRLGAMFAPAGKAPPTATNT